MRTLVGALVLLVGTAMTPAWGQIHREGVVEDIPPIVADTFTPRGDGVLWEARVEPRPPRPLYLRLRFIDITSPPGAAYSVVIRGRDDKELARYPAESFRRAPSFYTGVLFTDLVRIQVEGAAPPPGLSFKIDRVVREKDSVGRLTPQSIVAEWWSVAAPPDPFPLRFIDAVAKLYIGEGWICSGFLIAPDALVTNFHCLKRSLMYQATAQDASPDCSDIEIQFDFDRQPTPASAGRAPCRGVKARDPKLDYAVVAVDPNAVLPAGKSGRGVLKLSEQSPGTQVPVFIIHHPVGLAKKISLNCFAFPGGGDVIEHDCSTASGSSGSPVMGRDGTVIGLHFAGAYPESMTVGEIEDAIAEGKVFRNRARPIDLLRDALRPFVPSR